MESLQRGAREAGRIGKQQEGGWTRESIKLCLGWWRHTWFKRNDVGSLAKSRGALGVIGDLWKRSWTGLWAGLATANLAASRRVGRGCQPLRPGGVNRATQPGRLLACAVHQSFKSLLGCGNRAAVDGKLARLPRAWILSTCYEGREQLFSLAAAVGT